MIGGLVQDDQVRFQQQEFAQGNSGFLSPGEGGHRFFKFRLCKSQTFQHACDLAFVGIAAVPLKRVGQLVILFHK